MGIPQVASVKPYRESIGPKGVLWAIFGNEDDPNPPGDYLPGESVTWRRVCWWFRNPLHNLTFYVLGCADKPTAVIGRLPFSVFAPDGGWNWAFTFSGWFPRPFVSHRGERFQWYVGWRPPHGAIGIKFQKVQK